MQSRSSRPETRNPLLLIPEVAEFVDGLAPADRVRAHRAMLAISRAARARAEHAWSTRKGPMAEYWSTWSVNVRHAASALSRLIRKRPAGERT